MTRECQNLIQTLLALGDRQRDHLNGFNQVRADYFSPAQGDAASAETSIIDVVKPLAKKSG
jgi:hypothetical protein